MSAIEVRPIQHCPMCGVTVTRHKGRGRPNVYCSPKCRGRAYQSRHYAIDVHEVIDRWGDVCYLCGEVVNDDEPFGPKSLQVDHMIPLVLGGITCLDNLRVVHTACNMRKAARYVCPHCKKPL